MRYLLFAAILLQPLVEAFGYNYAAFLLFHGIPHSPGSGERVIAAVYGAHHRAVVRVALGPERYETYEFFSLA